MKSRKDSHFVQKLGYINILLRLRAECFFHVFLCGSVLRFTTSLEKVRHCCSVLTSYMATCQLDPVVAQCQLIWLVLFVVYRTELQHSHCSCCYCGLGNRPFAPSLMSCCSFVFFQPLICELLAADQTAERVCACVRAGVCV